MECFWALRLQYPKFDDAEFHSAVNELQSASYRLDASDSVAPNVASCVTAVRYAIKRATGWELPHFFVGDMARGCVAYGILNSKIIALDDAERGDLIFFHGKSSEHRAYMVSHMGVIANEGGEYFHMSWPNSGSIDQVESDFITGCIASCKMLGKFTDPRSEFGKRYERAINGW